MARATSAPQFIWGQSVGNDGWVLNDTIRDRLFKAHQGFQEAGKLLSQEALAACYARFRERFGPQVLAGLDGRQLLDKIHNHTNRDSLVYWLEFKDDDDFPAIFGSIAGGSALKFGIYRRKETGAWMIGTPDRRDGAFQREISEDEAIAIARRNRDQFLAGVKVMERLPLAADDAQYAELHKEMLAAAPDVADWAWGHKYFSVSFPDKLDDYHLTDLQRFHLLKLLQTPPTRDARYAFAGRFLALAREFGWPVAHLAKVLNEVDGRLHGYWRVGTTDDTRKSRVHWPMMRDGGCVAIGWNELGDLSDLVATQESKEELKRKYAAIWKDDPRIVGRKVQEIFNFCVRMEQGDLVVACDGATALAIGRVTGPYRFDASAGFVHQRPVEWLSRHEWSLVLRDGNFEGKLTTFHSLKEDGNLLAIERHLLPTKVDPPPPDGPFFKGKVGQIHQVLERKKQVILYGPPGTGKSYWAMKAAREMASGYAFGKDLAALTPEQKAEVVGQDGKPGLVRICSFHPAFGYEDFIEGWRPTVGSQGQPTFSLRPGLFKTLCEDAARQGTRRFYLVIDEINRGDIPRIFGELLTLLEVSKRDVESLDLPLSGGRFTVPSNVFVLGTMNTADRSIALLDTALRRRFGFIELMPDSSLLGKVSVKGVPVGAWLDALNRRIREHLGPDGRNLQVGHTYFLDAAGRPVGEIVQFKRVLQEDVLPLLAEYFYGNFEKLHAVLGEHFVDREGHRFNEEIFRDDERLVQALLASDPDITTTPEAIRAEASGEVPDDEEPAGDVAVGKGGVA